MLANWLRAAASEPTELRLTCAAEPIELIAETAPDGKPAALRRFRMTAYTGVSMNVEGFWSPVVVDLEGVRVPRQTVPVFRQHDPTQIVGHTDEVTISASRIRASGIMSGVGDSAQEVLQLASNGFPWQASIGASIQRREFVEAGNTVKVNGHNFTGPLIVARESTLGEISFVPLGADGNTSAAVAAQKGDTSMSFEAWLAAKGFDVAKLSDVQRTILQGAWKAETAPPPSPSPVVPPTPPNPPVQTSSVDDVVAAARAENARVQRITEIVAEVIGEQPNLVDVIEPIGRLAIQGKWDIQKTELEVLRARRPSGPYMSIPKPSPLSGEIVEAAVCVAGGLRDVEKQFAAPVLEAAHKKFRSGIGLQEMLLLAAEHNGYRERSFRGGDLGRILKAAFTPRLDVRASDGPSTYDLTGILSNIANKFLREGFMAVESAWRGFASIRPVNDFKTITSYSLTGDNTYEKVAPGGEIKHGSLGELSYTNKAETYGKMLGIDRRDLINDDLGAITGAPRRLGRGGALKLNDVFWTEWLDDSTFFPTDKSLANYDDGATDSVLSLAGLDNANTIFGQQTDPDGKPLGLMPTILLVPITLRTTALTLMSSTNLIDGTATAAQGSNNIWSSMFTVVSSVYPSNSAYTGYSVTAWWLLANPSDLSAIEVCFLNGADMPTIETAELDFDRLGIAMRGYYDFGVNKQEYRAGVKLKGAA